MTKKKKIISILVILIVFIVFYGFIIAPHNLKTKEIKITNSKIPNSFHGLKILQLSDIHYGSSTTSKDLTNILKEIKRLKPDITFFTGDLIESGVKVKEEEKKSLTDFLNEIPSDYGKFAITGEDDFNNSSYIEILENSNFKLLDESYEILMSETYDSIFLAGLSTVANGAKNSKDKLKPMIDYLNPEEGIEKPNFSYKILILHEPDIVSEIDYSNFDLILAGHSHLGQIKLPMIGGLCYPKYAKKFKNSNYTLENTSFYISGGIGTTKIPFRLFNTPEINFYRLTNH